MSEERKRRLEEKLAALDERLTGLRLQQEVAHIVEAVGESNLAFEWIPDARQIFHWVAEEQVDGALSFTTKEQPIWLFELRPLYRRTEVINVGSTGNAMASHIVTYSLCWSVIN